MFGGLPACPFPIGRTIKSILSQEHGDLELLIQDDASGDGTEEVCREYERLDSRVHFERNPVNLGMPGNLNQVISRAQAPLIANLHDGDIYRTDLLTKWIAAIVAEDAGFVFNAYQDGHRHRDA